MESTIRMRRKKRALSTIGGYGESRTPAINDQALTLSVTLANRAHTSTTPMFAQSLSSSDETASRCSNDYDQRSERREREPRRLAIHAVVDDRNQPRGGRSSGTNLLW